MEISGHLQSTITEQVNLIGVRFDNADLRRWVNALRMVEVKATVEVENNMQRLCAVELSQDVYNAIKGGKYSYQAYSPRYAKWKSENHPGKPFWGLAFDLANNLQAFRVTGGWGAGVPAGILDSGGKSWFGSAGYEKGGRREIAMYGAVNETRRPLFKLETQRYASGDWKNRGRVALREIGKRWR